MRNFILAAVLIAIAAPAGAKVIPPFDVKTCYKWGQDVDFKKQNPNERIKERLRQEGNEDAYRVTSKNVFTFRNIALRKHEAAQCRLRRQGKAYDRRCPAVVLSVDWVMANTPAEIWKASRVEGNTNITPKLDTQFEQAYSEFEEACDK